MLIRSPQDLALFITNQRKKRKLSQAEVGQLVGLKQQTLSEFEIRPDGSQIDTLFKILSALSLELELSDKNNPTNVSWKEEW